MVCTRAGTPHTLDGFKTVFFRAAKAIAPDLTFHGLRHTQGTMLAVAGCTEYEIAAAPGVTVEAAKVYTAQARQDQLAVQTVHKLSLFLDNR